MNLEEIDYLQKVQRYMMTMRPVFQPHALFSDETANYVEPMEPMPGETVTIRFRAGLNNVDSVFLISGSRKLLMDYEKTEGRFATAIIRQITFQSNTLTDLLKDPGYQRKSYNGTYC